MKDFLEDSGGCHLYLLFCVILLTSNHVEKSMKVASLFFLFEDCGII